jgi:hypothetical protein
VLVGYEATTKLLRLLAKRFSAFRPQLLEQMDPRYTVVQIKQIPSELPNPVTANLTAKRADGGGSAVIRWTAKDGIP